MSDPVHEALDHRDPEGARVGMWLFLLTEMLLFGGLFLLYAVYRGRYPHEFASAGKELSHVFGIANTFVLLTSSLSVACCLTALQKGQKRLCMTLLAVTALLAVTFLVNKWLEWGAKIHHGLYPGGPGLIGRPPGEVLFFGLYYSTTGLHGLHVLAGLIVLVVVLGLVAVDRVTPDDHVLLENAGLYWHLVDVVWIFILPLFYLTV
ncbi:MAG: cytochrome c oxidase subunit 3 [Candidatus Riflebacteria bacterium]|nr:cytochrome c oxidase subunit 3 [Candidatus Riflebacteria bacterium]